MSAITNLNFIERNVGSKIKSTKKQYIWEFTLDNLNHKIEYFDSILSLKRKVIVDGKVIFTTDDGYKDSFILNFQLDNHKLTINRSFDRVDLRIDAESFEHIYYIEKNKLFYNNNPEPTVYTTIGKTIENNNNFSLKDNFYSHQINQSQNSNQKKLFNFKIKNEEKKRHNFAKFKFGGDDNSFQNNNFQQVNNSFQNNNQKNNKINQNTQQTLNLLDFDIPNDEKIKKNNLSFQQSNNDLLNDIFGENNNNIGQNYVNMQNQFNNNNYMQNINQMNDNNILLLNPQMINQYNINQNDMNNQNQQLSQNNFNMNNQFNINNNNTQFQNNNLSNNNNSQYNLNNNFNNNQFINNNSNINQINNNMNYNMSNQFNINQFQNNNSNYQMNNSMNNQYNNMNSNQFPNNSNLNNQNYNMNNNNNLNIFY